MALIIHDSPEHRLSPQELDDWRRIPVAIIGDELNRAQIMHAATVSPMAWTSCWPPPTPPKTT